MIPPPWSGRSWRCSMHGLCVAMPFTSGYVCHTHQCYPFQGAKGFEAASRNLRKGSLGHLSGTRLLTRLVQRCVVMSRLCVGFNQCGLTFLAARGSLGVRRQLHSFPRNLNATLKLTTDACRRPGCCMSQHTSHVCMIAIVMAISWSEPIQGPKTDLKRHVCS